jgi:ABC-type branched-subunit amino acid transport system substrate-binding protein
VVGATALPLCFVALGAATNPGAGAQTFASSKLTTGLGNAEGGSLATQATKIAKKNLVGPAGSGLTNGVTSSSISIGCVYTQSNFPGFADGIAGAFAIANKAGGIDGRQLNLVPCKDDAASAQTNVTDVQQLVNQNQVFSVLTLSESTLPGSTDFLNSKQVPFLGWGFNPGFCGTRWGFGWNGCLGGNGFKEPIEAIAGNLGQGIFKATGINPKGATVAVQSESGTAGEVGLAQYKGIMTGLGAHVVYAKANMPITGVTDMTPYVQAILAGKPNVIEAATSFDELGPLVSGLRAAGYKGAIFDFTNYVPGLLATSPQLANAIQGQYVNTQVVPQEQNTPYVKQELSALRAAGAKPFLTLGASMGYAQATMMIEMLKAVGKNLNTKTFDAKINGGTFTSYRSVKGGPGKLLWPAAHYLPADCSAMVRVSGTNYKVVVPFTCYQSFKVG